jgi:diguanylate cyclase
LSEIRADQLAHGEAHRQLREFHLYSKPEPDAAVAPALAEPPPPDLPDGPEAADPATRLEHQIVLQIKAITRLKEEGRSDSALVALLKNAVRHEREITQAYRALRVEADFLRTQRDDLSSALRSMEALSLTDELTGLPNRRAFVQRLDQELSRCQRTGQPLAMVLLDIDNFKRVNDQHGHYVGDMILRSYAQGMVQELRQHDLLARYGGEEFVLLLPGTLVDDARNAMEKLAGRIRQQPFDAGDTHIDLPTFSAGIACLRPGEPAMSLINRADQSLYQAKRHGRNRIEIDEQLS